MFGTIFRKLIPSRNTRELRRMERIKDRINDLQERFATLDDPGLVACSDAFRSRLAAGESLDDLLPEAFAAVREAAQRTIGLRHFDVQLLGGIALHEGRIAEMRTGEGKTLVATLPVYLNALVGQGVHVVTVNDYLARRDADWMRPVYEALGQSVGVVASGQDGEQKRAAYSADITYGTNNEFGFDYLRDNMAFTIEDKVQRSLHYAIIDEVDSILIDEARTPLIISGVAEDASELYRRVDSLAHTLQPSSLAAGQITGDMEADGDFIVDEKHRQVELTESGHEKVEQALTAAGLLQPGDSLYAAVNLSLLHHVHAALRAHFVYKRDVDYVTQNGEVVIVDPHTGRTMPGRRWSEGLHQAIEAKERVTIQLESQTLASTTFQNFFRMYGKLSGMTGTADTEAFEFRQIYGLDVVVIPTNRPMVRNDQNDLVFLNMDDKYEAVADDIEDCHARRQPVLVGTASIESSERLSALLTRRGIIHKVLNAKFHEQEAGIIAQAGCPGAVTVATNMAGRGTDIVLGGNWEAQVADVHLLSDNERQQHQQLWQKQHDEVINAGGLHIVGTERHESRRIDNQLRGRSGRQGDPGSSRFYLSMEDNLMRIFAPEMVRNAMSSLGMEKGEAVEHRMVNNAIERAQRKVEGYNFDVRKNLLEYDDVANDQRKVIYAQRDDLMSAEDISETIAGMRDEVLSDLVSDYMPPQSLHEQWDLAGLETALLAEFNLRKPVRQWIEEDESLDDEGLCDRLLEASQQQYGEHEARIGAPIVRLFEKRMLLLTLDQRWKEHLQTMDQLRQGIHLRAYGQKQPKQEYKREAFELFQELLYQVRRDAMRAVSRIDQLVRVEQPGDPQPPQEQSMRPRDQQMTFRHEAQPAFAGAASAPAPANRQEQPSGVTSSSDGSGAPGQGDAPSAPPVTFVRDAPKVGRNAPCPCGSGKKYKQCCGRKA